MIKLKNITKYDVAWWSDRPYNGNEYMIELDKFIKVRNKKSSFIDCNCIRVNFNNDKINLKSLLFASDTHSVRYENVRAIKIDGVIMPFKECMSEILECVTIFIQSLDIEEML